MIVDSLKILDFEIKNCGYKEILKTIESNLSARTHFSFLNVNAYIVETARKDKLLMNDVNQFSALYADGIGIYLASKFLFGKAGLSERINGTDLYYQVLNLAQKNKYRVFFFGGGEKATSSINRKLEMQYPNLMINGVIQRDLALNELILQRINQSNSDILFLGLGTPHQEKWIATLGKKCNIPIQISVGSGIDFLSGSYKRAPILFQKLGLEWFFRLFLEPKRLWKRYILGIPLFLFRIMILKIKLTFK